MPLYRFSEASAFAKMSGSFDASCSLYLASGAEPAVRRREARLTIVQVGRQETIRNAKIVLGKFRGTLRIALGNDDARVNVHEGCHGWFDLRLWRESRVVIGRGSSANYVTIVCDRSSVIIGEDCMFSDEILIQSADQHGIVDLATGTIINDVARRTVIGDHVWLGRRSIIMPGVAIGGGSIVGAAAVVTSDVPPTCACAGSPARVVRTGVTWSRDPLALDPHAAELARHPMPALVEG